MQNLTDNIFLEDLKNQRRGLFVKVQEHFCQLKNAIATHEYVQAELHFAEVIRLGRFEQTITEYVDRLSSNQDAAPTFLLGSAVLHEAFSMLSAVRTESILYASGCRYGNSLTIEKLFPLRLETSSFGHATSDLSHSGQLLIEFERFGNVLTCYFHAHPGKGSQANLPSQIDLANQTKLEKGGYPTIGGIFSRDGYLRFFSEKNPFQISVSGKEVENVGKNLYRLKNPV